MASQDLVTLRARVLAVMIFTWRFGNILVLVTEMLMQEAREYCGCPLLLAFPNYIKHESTRRHIQTNIFRAAKMQ